MKEFTLLAGQGAASATTRLEKILTVVTGGEYCLRPHIKTTGKLNGTSCRSMAVSITGEGATGAVLLVGKIKPASL